MDHTLLIESRDNFGQADGGFCIDLARSFTRAGKTVSVLLVQNGVLPARGAVRAEGLAELVAAGVPVFADAFSLAERGIAEHQLAAGVRATTLDLVVDRLLDGWKVLWH